MQLPSTFTYWVKSNWPYVEKEENLIQQHQVARQLVRGAKLKIHWLGYEVPLNYLLEWRELCGIYRCYY